MQLLNTCEVEIKKSRFIAYLYEIGTKDDVKEIYQILKKEHRKARHIPYAYILSNTAGKSDDKEPSNTAGTPIFHILQTSSYQHHALFVVRYFGGVKLGAGGLMRAYANASKNVLR